MSVADIPLIMSRIKHAQVKSPIAVFKQRHSGTKEVLLDAVFANTAVAQFRIHKDDRNLVGVFDRNSNQKATRERLQKAVEK